MPLSEHEQRLLEQMERALYAEDPQLATTLRGSGGRFGARGLLVGGVLGVLAGIAMVITGVASQIPVVGVLGFLVMLGSTWLIVRGATAPSAEATTPAAAAGQRRSRGLMARAEERFQRRREEGPGRGH